MEHCISTTLKDQTNEIIIENLIKEYSTQIKRLAFTYVKDWSASEDITQEVFIVCYQKLSTYRGDGSIKNWLLKITVNKCKDYLRSKWYRSIVPVNSKWNKFENSSISSEDYILLKNESLQLSKTVLSLPTKYREIIILFYYEGLKTREIKELIGLNEQTIKTRLSRARKMLEKVLKECEEWTIN